jgi:C-terminal processing protease CtpA/Prc
MLDCLTLDCRMRRSIRIRFITAACLLLLAAIAIADETKGWFGFAANVDVDGVTDPTVQSVKIDSVVAGSPAASQGLKAGDELIEAEGMAVAGCKASELQARMSKRVGEILHLRLKHAGGENYAVDLVAAAKPKT